LLRLNSTKAELVLWRRLRDRQLGGFKFVRQEPLSRYYVDFLCRDRKLIVEVDGSQHADNTSDVKRDADLEALGYRVVRVWNNEVLGNIDGVLQMLLTELLRRPPHPPTLRAGPSLSPQAGSVAHESRFFG
jgi:very-short-patch-repair endonuclease